MRMVSRLWTLVSDHDEITLINPLDYNDSMIAVVILRHIADLFSLEKFSLEEQSSET